MRANPVLSSTASVLVLIGLQPISASAQEQVVGVATPNILWESDAVVRQTFGTIAGEGFGAVRIGWKQPYEDAEAALLEATRNGLDVLVTVPVIDRSVAGAGAEERPATEGFFAVYGLSQIDGERFEAAVQRLLEFATTSGVALIGIEIGNEMNWSGYNGDLPIGEGAIISDLEQIDGDQRDDFLAGLDSYVDVLARTDAMVEFSSLSDDFTILSGGLADINADYIEARGATLIEPNLMWQLLADRGAFEYLDAVGLHIYEPLRPGRARVERMEMLAAITDNCLSLQFGHLPCWITEFGMAIPVEDCAPDDLDRRQRLEPLLSYLATEHGAQRVPATFYYDWNEDAAFSLERCGIPTALTNDLTSVSTLSAN